MLTIGKETTLPDTLILHLRGQLTIETAADLRQELVEALGHAASRIQLDAAGLTEIDFFGLQLLCSAHRTAIVKNKSVTWFDNRPPQLNDSRSINGFYRHCGCTRCPPGVDCMWI